jgi:2-polyprenyl-6-methoxyphenol hydroxylase-like FAD-dependent oxidoreductase
MTAVGTGNLSFEVLSFPSWILGRKVAKQYRVENVFLYGYASQAFPHIDGLGLNGGLEDVDDSAYKIAASLRDWGGRALLDSYGPARQPIANLYAHQNVMDGK